MRPGRCSGHLFFADRYFGYDDAIYASCRMLELASRADLSRLLADLPSSVTTPEIRLPCPDDLKFALAERVCQRVRGSHDITDIDGVRVRFAHGWGLVRASNTQPVLVLRFEATTQARLDEYRTFVEGLVEEAQQELRESDGN
ncbi:MAG: hypothetical protein J4F42_15310 [Desulfurellaceae bacterium]|nr:hypothetical protein [Desulfurellaceae bacterium]